MPFNSSKIIVAVVLFLMVFVFVTVFAILSVIQLFS
jgi:hypothetical protein